MQPFRFQCVTLFSLKNMAKSFLSVSFIRSIEDSMDWYDHIAFSFLLFKQGEELVALEQMQRLIKLHERGCPEWKRVAIHLAIQSAEMNPSAVIEALFQLKQWKLLRLIGYSVSTPIEYIPRGHLFPFRVGIFCILDQLDRYDAHLLNSFINSMDATNEFQVIEVVVLQWIVDGIISTNDCSKLTIALGRIGRNDLVNLSLQLQSGRSGTSSMRDECFNQSISRHSTTASRNNRLHSSSSTGYCLIVHQKNIYRERDPILKHRVELDVPNYQGNEADCRTLRETFLSLGYRVDIAEDLTNFELKQKVLDVSRGVDWTRYNGLALCFLSHCIQDQILGSNSLTISFNKDVRKYFNECYCPGLKGKMKAIIFSTPFGSAGWNPVSQLECVGGYNPHLYDNFLVIWPTSYVLSISNGGSQFITEFSTELKKSNSANDVTLESFRTAIGTINNRNSLTRYRKRQFWSIQQWDV